MRPIHALLGLVVVLASGASAYVATHLAATEPLARPELSLPSTSAPSDATPALELRKTQDQVAMLTAQVDALRTELETLRNSTNRAPAASSEVAALEPAALGQVTQLQRETVLAVLEENRQREAAEAEALRVKTEQENAKRRAARVAKELNLSPGDETRLADLMFEGGKKRQEMFDSMRNGNFDREAMRTQGAELLKWHTDQLTQAFGASIADQIMQTEGGDRFFGGPGGPGGQGGFAGGNNGGGGQGGRGARRATAAGATGGAGPGGGQTQN
ncbi:MAG TPA: hypothetical protein VM509_10410 [Planctomycetota bacterium]|nr:hypothetical protein [Planctomycetota bacterium]